LRAKNISPEAAILSERRTEGPAVKGFFSNVWSLLPQIVERTAETGATEA
jgi:hypothetical protein